MSKHEKHKTGGLLENWFGRPKGARGGNYNSGGTLSGRPNSTDTDAIDLQELEKNICALSDSDVDVKFMEILEDMNIPKDKRAPLLSKSITERQKMIFMHLKGEFINKFIIFYATDKINLRYSLNMHMYMYAR